MFIIPKAKKLALILVTSTSMIVASMEVVSVLNLETLIFTNFFLLLKYVLYIHYLVQFIKNQAKVQALLDSDIEVNVMTPAYMAN